MAQTMPKMRCLINILWDTDTVRTAGNFFAANHAVEQKRLTAQEIPDLCLRTRSSDNFIL